jgi:hydrogenase expression/formation protein HypD
MKFIDEYRDEKAARTLVGLISRTMTRPWTLMEICGGQTHTIVKYGMENLLPRELTLVHGPGCPVCVTPLEMIDKAIAIAALPSVIFTSFGDMMRVPGSSRDLLSVKASGGDVRLVYSPLDAVAIARQFPEKKIVFFAVGFETTAPANAAAVWQARQLGLKNFSILCSHVLVPPAIETILRSPTNRVQGFLAAGHVCAVMGYEEYLPLAERYHIPIIITGFEPLDIFQGTCMAVQQLEAGKAVVENQYSRVVVREGNIPAQQLMRNVFEVTDRSWRGIGEIPRSGLRLRQEFAPFDAERIFDVAEIHATESPLCIAGQVLQGIKRPPECSEFGARCSPEHPLGAPMVSSEGACAAYYRYRRFPVAQGEVNEHDKR